MSSGFLLAQALSKALRKPYTQGDRNITVHLLVKKQKMGPFRVMLKRNFDTACWVPPVGRRDSHSIYYGDRMVARVFEFFVKKNGIKMPSKEEFVEITKKAREAEKAAYQAAVDARALNPKKARLIPLPEVSSIAPQSQIFDAKVQWLSDNLPPAQWDELIELLVQAIAAYGRHERGHARQTPQDLKVVNQDLKTLGIPFTFFNLFEDARMEAIERDALGAPFGWTEFEDLAPVKNAFSMFLRRIQLENAPDPEAIDSEELYEHDTSRTLGNVAESVEAYYRRAILCSTAEKLYPVIIDFLKEFHEEVKPPPKDDEGEEGGEGGGGGGGGSESSGSPSSGAPDSSASGGGKKDEEDDGPSERAGDLSTAAEAAEKGDDFFDSFESDTEVVGGTDEAGAAAEEEAKEKLGGKMKPPVGKPDAKGLGIAESIEPQESGGRARESDFLAQTAGAVDEAYRARIDNLTQRLMRMFKSHTLPAALESPGQRMSSRHLARGEFRWVHKRVFGGKGKRQYTVVYDCSGSMRGHPDREGKLLVLALNNLAKRGFLEGNLILSGYVRDGRPGWLSFKFPVKEEIILSIVTNHMSEGLQTALADNIKDLKGKDDVFVMTDAHITDAPINRDFFAKHRVWPVGLYVGPESNAKNMQKHFPQNIIRSNIEDVVEAMLTRNKRTAG